MNRKVLVAEDDASILMALESLLSGEGFEVIQAKDGKEALEAYRTQRPCLLLLDIMMPALSGYDVCRAIRKEDSRVPILMVTAKGEEVDKVIGLEIGADDYIVKPFGLHELLARVRALLRRVQVLATEDNSNRIRFGVVEVDPKTLKGRNADREFEITLRELELLQELFSHPGEVLRRDDLLEKFWGMRYEGTTRTLDQHILKLRQKVEPNPSEPCHILTVHGAGYRFIA